MEQRTTRYGSLTEGRFHRKAKMDSDRRPGELDDMVARARTGDRDALQYLYLRFAGNIYGYARSIVRNEHEAEDITQQVFVRLITAVRTYEPRGVPFSAWLMRIAHNAAIDHVRRRQRVGEAPEEFEAAPGNASHDGELTLALREALEELPEVQRKVLVLRHWAGWSPSEIAAELDRSEDSIHGLHHRGRRALQDALRRAGATPMTVAA